MKITLEKHWEKGLQEAAITAGMHVVPLPDDCKVGFASGSRSTNEASQKPYDFGLCVDGQYVAIECKLSKAAELSADKIKKHQHEGLQSAYRSGALPILAVYFKFKVKGVVYENGFLIDYSWRATFEKIDPNSISHDFLCRQCGLGLIRHCGSDKGLTAQPIRDILNQRRKQ